MKRPYQIIVAILLLVVSWPMIGIAYGEKLHLPFDQAYIFIGATLSVIFSISWLIVLAIRKGKSQ